VVSGAVLLAAAAGICAVLAAWELIAAAEQVRLVRGLARWLAPALDVLRSGREPTSPERLRLVALGAVSLLGAGWLVAGPWIGLALGAAAPWVARTVVRARAQTPRCSGGAGPGDRPRACRCARGRALRARRDRCRRGRRRRAGSGGG